MTKFICKNCQTVYEIDQEELETVYNNSEFFQCSECGSYVPLKTAVHSSETIHTSSENKFKKILIEILDVELLKYFFKFSWMKYKHPAARLFDKLATLAEIWWIYYGIVFIGQMFVQDKSLEIVINSFLTSIMMWCAFANVIFYRVFANFLEKYLKISEK